MHAQAEAMTLDKLAMMVQAGFLDMGIDLGVLRVV